MAQWPLQGRKTERILKQICAHSASRTQRAKFNNNGNNLSNQPGQKRRQRSLVQTLLDNNDRSQYGHHGERVMRYVACKTNFVVHTRGAQRSNCTNSACNLSDSEVVIKVLIHMIVPSNRCELLVHNTRHNTVILQTHIQK